MSLKKAKSNFTSKKLKNAKKPSPKAPIIVRKVESEESDSSENYASDDENQWKDTKRTVGDPTPDYQNIQKLVRYVKAGNTTATIVSLCCLKDYDLSISMNQLVSIYTINLICLSITDKCSMINYVLNFLLFAIIH